MRGMSGEWNKISENTKLTKKKKPRTDKKSFTASSILPITSTNTQYTLPDIYEVCGALHIQLFKATSPNPVSHGQGEKRYKNTLNLGPGGHD